MMLRGTLLGNLGIVVDRLQRLLSTGSNRKILA
jgi:hypothetical protein